MKKTCQLVTVNNVLIVVSGGEGKYSFFRKTDYSRKRDGSFTWTEVYWRTDRSGVPRYDLNYKNEGVSSKEAVISYIEEMRANKNAKIYYNGIKVQGWLFGHRVDKTPRWVKWTF